MIELYNDDCIARLKLLPDNSVDSIVTDPPYELGFMGKAWDNSGIAYNVEMWSECLRVLKHGGHLLAFGGTRTYHRMAVAIEDAGFEVRDMIEWVYGSGFPKSLNIGKAVDKLQGNEREKIQYKPRPETSGTMSGSSDSRPWIEESRKKGYHEVAGNIPISDEAKQYEGWGTNLKPSHEPICMARKPLSEKTVAENVLKWGTGGINIDESRVDVADSEKESFAKEWDREQSDKQSDRATYLAPKEAKKNLNEFRPTGRFPANLIHDNSEEVRDCFPETGGGKFKSGTKRQPRTDREQYGDMEQSHDGIDNYGDSGNASRFFKSIIYQAKASKSERNKGCDGLELREIYPQNNSLERKELNATANKRVNNNHPTVKPIALMAYLIKLVTPKGGTVLDPFMGSGTTGVAAKENGFSFIGIELMADHFEICEARINNASVIKQEALFE